MDTTVVLETFDKLLANPEAARFAVGALAGFIVLNALLRLRFVALAILAGIVGSIIYVFIEGGPDALVMMAETLSTHLRARPGFYQGLLAGKFLAALMRSLSKGRFHDIPS